MTKTDEQLMRVRKQREAGLFKSWAHEFWLLRRREKAKFFVIVALLGVIILLEILP